MPKIQTWDNLPIGVRHHLIERMLDRSIRLGHLNQLCFWVESEPSCRMATGAVSQDVLAALSGSGGFIESRCQSTLRCSEGSSKPIDFWQRPPGRICATAHGLLARARRRQSSAPLRHRNATHRSLAPLRTPVAISLDLEHRVQS